MNQLREWAGIGIAAIIATIIWMAVVCVVIGGAVGLVRLAQYFWRISA